MFLIVLLTALIVGGATMAGAAVGYLFRGAARRLGEGLLLSFTADMIPAAQSQHRGRLALLLGFCFMLAIDYFVG